jgi:WhiB family redox-sensing transcriptional regulator
MAMDGCRTSHTSNILNIAPLSHNGRTRYRHAGFRKAQACHDRPSTVEHPAHCRGRGGDSVAIQMLPFPNAVTDWRSLAQCRDTDPDLFFPVGTTGLALDQIAAAKTVCMGCAARQDCLDYALDSHQDSGVWGGLSEEERRVIRRERAAARKAMASSTLG